MTIQIEKEALEGLPEKSKKFPLTVGDIVHTLEGRGRFLLVALLAIPYCQPIFLPYFSTPFGVLILYIGLRTSFGKKNRFPKWLLKKKVSHKVINYMSKVDGWVLKFIKKISIARLTYLATDPVLRVLHGLMLAFCSLFFILPFLFLPLSNTAAAFVAFFISLGLFYKDGLFILFGYVTFLLSVAGYIAYFR